MVYVVGTGRGETGFLRDARADVGIGAAVPPHLAFARGDLAGLVDRALDAERARVLGQGVELLFHGERDLHRPLGHQRQHSDQGFQLDVELAAEAAAEERHADAEAVLRPAEQARDLKPHEGRALRRGVNGHALAVGLGDRDVGLERDVQHLLRLEGVLENAVGGLEGLVGIAVLEMEIERDVGVTHTVQVLEVGEGARRLELVVHDDLGRLGLDLVEDRRQFLVVHFDQARRLLGHVRVARDDGCDRLANIDDLVDGEDRLVVEGGPVIGMRDDLADVGAGDDALDARHLHRLVDVDRLDAAVRDGGTHELGDQHAGQPHRVHVFDAAGDFRTSFEPGQRAADFAAAGRGHVVHWAVPPISSACRSARST